LLKKIPRDGCDWEETPTISIAASSSAVRGLQQLTSFDLPIDLTEFFSITDLVSAMAVHNGYAIGGVDNLVRSIQRRDFPSHVDCELVVPIGSLGNDDAFLIDSRGVTYLWRHESGSTTIMADSFSSFLQRVADDWHAYVYDVDGWQFMSS
jgi:hypothetical protein